MTTLQTSPVSVRPSVRGRLLLLALGGVSLLAGLDAALLLAGLPAPVTAERLEQVHGSLMMLGFLGTLISLERAVALRRRWAYVSPALFGAGSLLLLSPLPVSVGHAVQFAGAVCLVVIYRALAERANSDPLLIQWLGAVMAAGAGALWWIGVPTPSVLPFLTGFLVLTIAGERLELARVAAPGPGAQKTLLALAGAVLLAACAALLWPAVGGAAFGMVLLGVVAWLVRYDVATRLLHARGLPRYIAVNLVAGMVWLAVAGATWLLWGAGDDGPAYDIAVHAVGLGFAMSMVLAHAPVILPAVLRRPLPYRPVLYAATLTLQVSLLARFVADVRDLPAVWQAGAAVNVLAVLGFVLISAGLVIRK